MITVAICEKDTDKWISYKTHADKSSPFHIAVSDIERCIDTLYKTTTEQTEFIVYILVDEDNPLRFFYSHNYKLNKRQMEIGRRTFNETGRYPYAPWSVPEDIDTFPSDPFTSDSKAITWRTFSQASRFDTYANINKTFENRILARLIRKVRNRTKPVDAIYDNEAAEDMLDFVIQVAKKQDEATEMKWIMNRVRHATPECNWTVNNQKEFLALMKRAYPDEIAILQTIYKMQSEHTDCAAIVTTGMAMLRDYDKGGD